MSRSAILPLLCRSALNVCLLTCAWDAMPSTDRAKLGDNLFRCLALKYSWRFQCCFDRERPLPREDCEKTVIRAWTNYQVIYSTSTSVADAVCVNHVAGQHAAIVHRKILGAKREVQVRRDGDSVLLILEGGFPRGGENGADVHAPW